MTEITFALALLLSLGFLIAKLGQFLKLPSVTGYILAGLILGPSGLGLITEEALGGRLDHFSQLALMLIAFGIVFELPVIIFFLSKMGIVDVAFLRKKRKYALLLAFAMAAILTPPDVITQGMMALPLILLYEIGILVAWLGGSKKSEEKGEDEEIVED